LVSGLYGTVGKLWGILFQAGQEIRRDFVLTNLERVAIRIATGPAGVVASGDADVRVPQLAAYVAELDTRRQKLGRECVPEVLGRSKPSGSISLDCRTHASLLAESAEVAVPVVGVVQWSNRPLSGP
jgi:hypothetical protein